MNQHDKWISRVEAKVSEQLHSQNVGYLIGAGASHLDSHGYPLAGELWNAIVGDVPTTERGEIQAKLNEGANGIEQALDLLDDGALFEKPHRSIVTQAIAKHFMKIKPPLDAHRAFVRGLAQRNDLSTSIFCLNYDPLIEWAADEESVRLCDGFIGIENGSYSPQTFQQRTGLPHRGRRRPQIDWICGTINLFKLHGSLGWFQLDDRRVRRISFTMEPPNGAKRLMVPPQHRKGTDTTAPPYASLWTEFRGQLCQGPDLLNRLVAIGYGFRDEHLNPIIDNALSRSNFTLLIFAQKLAPEVFDRWATRKNVTIVTENRCFFDGTPGVGHPTLWKFEELCQKL